MSGRAKLITAATAEPISLAEAKLHCQINHAEEDYLIFGWMRAAREYVEEITGRALLTSTWDLYLDDFPCREYIALPKGQLQSITSLTYTNSAATSAVWSSGNYIVDTASEPSRLHLAYGISWPTVTLQPINGVVVRFVAGWSTPFDVPFQIKAAMKLLIRHWYDNRSAVTVGNTAAAVSEPLAIAVDALLANHRIWI